MSEPKQNQAIDYPPGFYRIETTTTTPHTPGPDVPQLISKQWLADRFGMRLQSGRINYGQLYTKVLTHEVLEAMGTTMDRVRRIDVRTFTRQQTLQLIEILKL